MSVKLDLEVSEGMIRDAIAVAVAESFSGDKRDALLRDIIRAHLSYKAQSYDKETLLSKTMGESVRRIANEEVKRVVDTDMAPVIRDIVGKMLGEAFRETVYAQLRDALGRVVIGRLHLSVVPEDDS